jgi:hypothetical protein
VDLLGVVGVLQQHVGGLVQPRAVGQAPVHPRGPQPGRHGVAFRGIGRDRPGRRVVKVLETGPQVLQRKDQVGGDVVLGQQRTDAVQRARPELATVQHLDPEPDHEHHLWSRSSFQVLSGSMTSSQNRSASYSSGT